MQMTLPIWVLLGFAGWTLLLLFSTVGVYRWSRILTGRATVREWNSSEPQGSGWYQRAMKAHMNCVENLPVYGAVAVAILATGARGPALDVLAICVLAARIVQSLIHIIPEQTETVAIFRFVFYFTQIVCMFAMGILVVLHATSA